MAGNSGNWKLFDNKLIDSVRNKPILFSARLREFRNTKLGENACCQHWSWCEWYVLFFAAKSIWNEARKHGVFGFQWSIQYAIQFPMVCLTRCMQVTIIFRIRIVVGLLVARCRLIRCSETWNDFHCYTYSWSVHGAETQRSLRQRQRLTERMRNSGNQA